MRKGGHGRIIGSRVALLVIVIPSLFRSCACRGIIVLIIKRYVGEGWLWKRLSDEFTLLVLVVGEVTSSFLLGESGSLGESLLVPSFDDL